MPDKKLAESLAAPSSRMADFACAIPVEPQKTDHYLPVAGTAFILPSYLAPVFCKIPSPPLLLYCKLGQRQVARTNGRKRKTPFRSDAANVGLCRNLLFASLRGLGTKALQKHLASRIIVRAQSLVHSSRCDRHIWIEIRSSAISQNHCSSRLANRLANLDALE